MWEIRHMGIKRVEDLIDNFTPILTKIWNNKGDLCLGNQLKP